MQGFFHGTEHRGSRYLFSFMKVCNRIGIPRYVRNSLFVCAPFWKQQVRSTPLGHKYSNYAMVYVPQNK